MKSSARVFRFRGCKMVGVWAWPRDGGRRFPAVLFLHGFPGAEKNVDLQRALLRKGVASFLLHFRGAWGSEGTYRFSHLLDDARAGLRFMAGRPGVDRRRLAVFGYSMGGWAALHLAAVEPGLSAAVAVAPVGGAEMITPQTPSNISRMCRPLRTGSAAALARDFAREVRRRDPAASAARLRCPLLLIHGTRDGLVPPAVSRRIYAAAPGPKRLILVRGAEHDFLAQRELLVRRVTRWLVPLVKGSRR